MRLVMQSYRPSFSLVVCVPTVVSRALFVNLGSPFLTGILGLKNSFYPWAFDMQCNILIVCLYPSKGE